MDVRGCYCALAACEMLLLDKSAVADACGMVDYICRCQVCQCWRWLLCCVGHPWLKCFAPMADF